MNGIIQVAALFSIIAFTRGYVSINEQLLVALCFIAFVSTTVLYAGDDVAASLQERSTELTEEYKTYEQNMITYSNRVKEILRKRKVLALYVKNLNQLIAQQKALIVLEISQKEQAKLHAAAILAANTLAKSSQTSYLIVQQKIVQQFRDLSATPWLAA